MKGPQLPLQQIKQQFRLIVGSEGELQIGDLVVALTIDYIPWPAEIKKVYRKSKIYMVKFAKLYKLAYLTKGNIFPLNAKTKQYLLSISGQQQTKIKNAIENEEIRQSRARQRRKRKAKQKEDVALRRKEKMLQIKKQTRIVSRNNAPLLFDLGEGFQDIVHQVKQARKLLTQNQARLLAFKLSKKIQKKNKRQTGQRQNKRPFFLNQDSSSDSDSESKKFIQEEINYQNIRIEEMPLMPQAPAAEEFLQETQVQTNFDPNEQNEIYNRAALQARVQDNDGKQQQVKHRLSSLTIRQDEEKSFEEEPSSHFIFSKAPTLPLSQNPCQQELQYHYLNNFIRNVKNRIKKRHNPYISMKVLKPLTQQKKQLLKYMLNIDLLLSFMKKQLKVSSDAKFSQSMLILVIQYLLQEIALTVCRPPLLDTSFLENGVSLLEIVFENNMISMLKFSKSDIVWNTIQFLRIFQKIKWNENEELTVVYYRYLKSKYMEWEDTYEDRCQEQGVKQKFMAKNIRLFKQFYKESQASPR